MATLRLKTVLTTAIVLVATSAVSQAALACACELECKPGEIYSDEAEMCVPVPVS